MVDAILVRHLPLVLEDCLTHGALRSRFRPRGACSRGRRRDLLRRLREMGADPLSGGFVSDVLRRPQVRGIVARAVFDWYRAGARGASGRVARQGPAGLAQTFRQLVGSRPVYYLWEREEGSGFETEG